MAGTLLIAAILASAPAGAAPRGCASHWAIELDRGSFAQNGAGRTFTTAQLAAFRTRIQAQLRAAAADACASGRVPSLRAAGIRRVRLFSASGASELHFYSGPKGVLNFEWVFAEQGLAVPARANMVGGLVCWADPKEPLCADEGD